jgi:hypothetical protein
VRRVVGRWSKWNRVRGMKWVSRVMMLLEISRGAVGQKKMSAVKKSNI